MATELEISEVMDRFFKRGVDAGSWTNGEGDYWTIEVSENNAKVYDGTGEWWEGTDAKDLASELKSANS